eukprot:TRINITY_DN984_c2_g1_i1.p1 TRINITY_DN984_c2_g1~~TRINITY_DN984_c2_g1_i1.p1  ORF type:complete len:741 (+),score=248.27 TRINITY_DN984_c2_g1_i1:81-2225(+)
MDERRVDPADGEAYTRAEFIAEYGGLTEWSAAAPVAAAESAAADSGPGSDADPSSAAPPLGPSRLAMEEIHALGDDFDAVFGALRDEVEAADPAGKLHLAQYSGPGGVRVVCQEAFHHNFDLTHEHWGEVVPPEIDAARACHCCKGALEGHARGGVRPSESIAFVQILVAGDKAAGKTTWLNGLTTGHLRVLQALRYDAGVFYNIWYAPAAADLRELLVSMRRRRLPFFQTELAHGAMLLQASELRFFLEDEELADSEDPGPTEAVCRALDESEHAMVRLLELGGDALHELRSLTARPTLGPAAAAADPCKEALLRQIAQTVGAARRVAYFVSLSALLVPHHGDAPGSAGAGGPGALLERLEFIRAAAPAAEITLLCTRPSGDCDVRAAVGEEAARRCAAAAGAADSEVGALSALGPFELVGWLARRAGVGDCRIYGADHLGDGDATDHHACLRTLRRLLRGDAVLTPGGALPLVAEQAANLLFNRGTQLVDQERFADLMEDFEGAIEGADVYRNVVHPMLVLPPAAVLANFDAAMELLQERGLAAPARSNGAIPLVVEWVTGDGREGSALVEGPAAEAPGLATKCWRLLRLPACLAEARKGLNLFTGDSAAHRVGDAARQEISAEGAQRCRSCPAPAEAWDALCDLYMSHAFLARAGGAAGAAGAVRAEVSLPDGAPLLTALSSPPPDGGLAPLGSAGAPAEWARLRLRIDRG